jgi:hypothetical protein
MPIHDPIYLRCPESWRGKIRSDHVCKLFNEFLRGRTGLLGGSRMGEIRGIGPHFAPGFRCHSPANGSFGRESAAAAYCFRSGSHARCSKGTLLPDEPSPGRIMVRPWIARIFPTTGQAKPDCPNPALRKPQLMRRESGGPQEAPAAIIGQVGGFRSIEEIAKGHHRGPAHHR